MTLLEALSYALPVTVSDIKENTEVVKDTGLVFTTGNVASLRRKLSLALTHPKLMNTLSLKGVERVKTHYQWAHVVAATKRCYLETLKVTGWVAKSLKEARS